MEPERVQAAEAGELGVSDNNNRAFGVVASIQRMRYIQVFRSEDVLIISYMIEW
ncbi:GM17953 [Drosophila sechellia]|uniref:GM17953 n=1 Tax=Drosophila sechellia TaxID=7238 RepID=B4I1T0_DROSE|nr:GM17953 [Drosophila sechellia]